MVIKEICPKYVRSFVADYVFLMHGICKLLPGQTIQYRG